MLLVRMFELRRIHHRVIWSQDGEEEGEKDGDYQRCSERGPDRVFSELEGKLEWRKQVQSSDNHVHWT